VKQINTTPFPFAVLPAVVRPPEWSASLLVKASFALRPGGPALELPEPLPLSGDVYRDEDVANDCLYESDFAPRKQNADVLLVGTCHAPGGKATPVCRVEFGVGRWSKALAVIGNRRWKKSLLLSSASDPEPFVTLPVNYVNAFGGEGFEKNPAGRGYERAFLPNIEPLEGRISAVGERPDPAGFGPLNRTWPQRASKLGSYKGKWLKERWPHFPDDFDLTYHNAAPLDQQFRTYLRGDEDLRFENLHPKHPSYRSALPGLRIRCFLSETLKGGRRFREVPMNLDTLFVDMDREILVLVWRGVASAQSEDLAEIEHALLVSEALKVPAAAAESFQALLPKPAPPPVPAEPAAGPAPKPPDASKLKLEAAKEQAQKLEAAHLEGARTLAKQFGFDLEAALAKPPAGVADLHASLLAAKATLEKLGAKVPGILDAEIAAVAPGGTVEDVAQKSLARALPTIAKPPVTPESLKTALAKSGGLQGKSQDLTGAKLAGSDLSGLDLTGAILKGADLSGAKLVKTLLRKAQLSEADLTGADLTGALLEGADLTRARLDGANLGGAALSQANLSGASAIRAVFTGAQASKAIFAGAHLEDALFEKALLAGADLSRAALRGAKFSGAILTKAALSGARGESAEFKEADLTGAYGDAGANFKKALFVKAIGPQSVWEGSVLDDADFTGAHLERANFAGASLQRAKFGGADAKNASFRKASLRLAQAVQSDFFEATFEKADLSGVDFTGSNLFGSEFLGSILEGTKLGGANVRMSKLG
jgi:uncharacterized protein YjbI with pentapeptide repeats